MSDKEEHPQVGQVVRILQGRDEGRFAIIIAVLNERFVHLADGDKRKFDSPKKKNVRHLKFFPYISSVVTDNMKETGRVTNGKLRFALNQFLDQFEEDQEKGE